MYEHSRDERPGDSEHTNETRIPEQCDKTFSLGCRASNSLVVDPEPLLPKKLGAGQVQVIVDGPGPNAIVVSHRVPVSIVRSAKCIEIVNPVVESVTPPGNLDVECWLKSDEIIFCTKELNPAILYISMVQGT